MSPDSKENLEIGTVARGSNSGQKDNGTNITDAADVSANGKFTSKTEGLKSNDNNIGLGSIVLDSENDTDTNFTNQANLTTDESSNWVITDEALERLTLYGGK
jgi:hypothetical protein